MVAHLYRRPASKQRVFISHELRRLIVEMLATHSQNQIARQLGISQSAVGRIAQAEQRRQAATVPR